MLPFCPRKRGLSQVWLTLWLALWSFAGVVDASRLLHQVCVVWVFQGAEGLSRWRSRSCVLMNALAHAILQ